jgi:ABC-type phosphate transport system substrate-binding protein
MKHIKQTRRALLAGAVLALSVSAPAFAATTPAPGTSGVQNPSGTFRGTDGIADHVHMGGSDTVYDVLTALAAGYNSSVGCGLAVGASYCSSPTSVFTENADHDVIDNEYPTGSGNGRAKLLGNLDLDLVPGVDVDPAFRIARSSGAPTESGTFGSAFAKDGIAVVGFFGNPNNPAARVLSLANLQAIFSGTGPQSVPDPSGTNPSGTCATNWNQLTNPLTNTAFPAQPIKPFGIQSGSGTYAFFKSYVGGDPDTCPGKPHGGGNNFFENNTAPIDGGTGTDGTLYASPDTGRANAIWWLSSAVAVADPVSNGTATPYQIRTPGVLADGTATDPNYDLGPTSAAITIQKGQPGAYDLQRKLYIVLKNTDMNPGLGAGWTGDTGPGGAATSFRNWLCRRTGHATAPKNYGLVIQKAIESNGMVRISNGESSANPFVQAGDPQEKCNNVSIP